MCGLRHAAAKRPLSDECNVPGNRLLPAGIDRSVEVLMRLLAATAGLLLAVVGAPAQTQSAVSWSGTLLDAGCTDRSLQNLRAQPTQTLATSKPAQKSPDEITVTPQVTKSERGDTV